MGMFDFPSDYVSITLVDRRGRTVLKFIREKPDANWIVSDFLPRHNRTQTVRQRDTAPHRVARLPDEGRAVLEVPGLTLRWERVTPILDRLAENAITQISVRGLRDCVR